MALSFTLDPKNPIPNRRARIVPSGTSGNVQRARIKAAPKGSEFDTDDNSQIELETVLDFPERVGDETIVFTPDLGGKYTIILEDIQKGSAKQGSFLNSPNSIKEETILETAELTAVVSTPMNLRLGVSPDTATLRFFVNENIIVSTNRTDHGERSPAVVFPRSQKARIALSNSNFQNELNNLKGQAATGVVGQLKDVIDNMITNFESHFDSNSFHNNPDTSNAIRITRIIGKSNTNKTSIIQSANNLRQLLQDHMENNATNVTGGDGYDQGGTNVHFESGNPEPDKLNLPVAPAASDSKSLITLLADLWRAFENHRQRISNPASHSSIDNINTLTDLSALSALLLKVEKEFISAILNVDPNVPANEDDGVVRLITAAGAEAEGIDLNKNTTFGD